MSAGSPRHIRVIARWKITGGAFVHFALPLYLLAAIGDSLRIAAAGGAAPAIVAGVLRDSGYLLSLYAALALAATGLAAGIDAIEGVRNRARDPRAALAARFGLALASTRGRFGPRADTALAGLAAFDWNQPDPRLATLAQHGEALIAASLRAAEQSGTDRHDDIAERTAEALETLAGEACLLHKEVSAMRDAEAAALARFVVARYGTTTLDQSADSAGDAR
jgi:hypothetical protein